MSPTPTSTLSPIAETPAAATIERGAALMARREADFRRTARRFSSSPEDAEDALGRAIEILLRKGPDLAEGSLAAWMHVVTRREALAIGRSRRRAPLTSSAPGEVAFDPDLLPTTNPGPEQAFERRERVARAAELLAGLKAQERRALALLGAGCSYAEIQAITGWTYTKVNRCIAEGRAALRRRARELEAA